MARGAGSGLGGNFERAFVRLSGAFAGRTHRWVTEKSFQLSFQIFAICPFLGPHTVLLGGGYYSQNVVCLCHQYLIPIAQWAFCNARGNTSPTNQLHSPVRVVPDPFPLLLKVRNHGGRLAGGNCRFWMERANGGLRVKLVPHISWIPLYMVNWNYLWRIGN